MTERDLVTFYVQAIDQCCNSMSRRLHAESKVSGPSKKK